MARHDPDAATLDAARLADRRDEARRWIDAAVTTRRAFAIHTTIILHVVPDVDGQPAHVDVGDEGISRREDQDVRQQVAFVVQVQLSAPHGQGDACHPGEHGDRGHDAERLDHRMRQDDGLDRQPEERVADRGRTLGDAVDGHEIDHRVGHGIACAGRAAGRRGAEEHARHAVALAHVVEPLQVRNIEAITHAPVTADTATVAARTTTSRSTASGRFARRLLRSNARRVYVATTW